tara:strand:+ start:472 stop:717 length:246 start_codon:yes stop_codon:yes gene_type:complete
MIRLNIKKNGKVEVKSFITKGELIKFLRGDENFLFTEIPNNCFNIADKLWDLNVGTALTQSGYTFAMAGKSRAGNIMLGGK